MEDMNIDMDAFDFSMLDDGNIKEFPLEGGTMKQGREAGEDTDFPDFDEDSSDLFGGEVLEEDVDFDSEERMEELQRQAMDEKLEADAKASQYLAELEDEAALDLGGITMTKAQLKELASSRERLTEDYEFIRQHAENFSQHNAAIKGVIQRNALETQITIDAINAKLNHPNTSAYERGELYQALKQQEGKIARINQEYGRIEEARRAQEAQDLAVRVRETQNVMSQTYGKDWNPQAVFDYAVQNGLTDNMMKQAMSPAFVNVLMKAYQHDVGKARTEAKLKESMSKAPRSKSSARSNDRTKQTSEASAMKRALVKKMEAGNFSESDLSNSFAFLED